MKEGSAERGALADAAMPLRERLFGST